MKITYYDKFALTPKRCSICNKLFWLEWYNYKVKLVGIEMYPLELPVCRGCAEEKNNRCNFVTHPRYEERAKAPENIINDKNYINKNK